MSNGKNISNEDIIAMCSTTAADVKNICNTLDGIKQYISKQIDQHATTNCRLAVIERVQQDMKDNITSYQQDCTKDRNDQQRRILSIENFRSNQIKAAGAAGGLVAFLVGGGIKVFDKLFS